MKVLQKIQTVVIMSTVEHSVVQSRELEAALQGVEKIDNNHELITRLKGSSGPIVEEGGEGIGSSSLENAEMGHSQDGMLDRLIHVTTSSDLTRRRDPKDSPRITTAQGSLAS